MASVGDQAAGEEPGRAAADQAGRMVGLIGELAGVKVYTHPKTGNVKFASAHDLRRSFGNRWARQVKTPTLQRLMRHESIQTTLAYYVDLDVDELAEDLWKAHEKGRQGTVLGTVGDSGNGSADTAADLKSNGDKGLQKHARQESNLQPAD